MAGDAVLPAARIDCVVNVARMPQFHIRISGRNSIDRPTPSSGEVSK
jgi:hypothetical protein